MYPRIPWELVADLWYPRSTHWEPMAYTNILPVDFPTNMKHCFVAETDFWQKYFIFCRTVHHVHAEFKIYHLATSSVGKTESKAFSKNFLPICLVYVQLAASPTCWLPWTSQISLPNTISCPAPELGRPELFSPYRCSLCSQIFYPYVVIEFGFVESRLNFFTTSCWILLLILLNESPARKTLFFCSAWVTILRLCALLVETAEIASNTCVHENLYYLLF
jgi:hypothetical protein